MLSNFDLHLFLASAAMLMTSESLLGFSVFCSWWQCKKQVVCVGRVRSVSCQPMPCTQPLRHAGMVHIWWLDQGDAMHDDLRGKAMDMILWPPECWEPHAECRLLLIGYLKQARWKITRTDRCTNRGTHVCKGRFQRCDPSQSWERHSTRLDKRHSQVMVRSDLP